MKKFHELKLPQSFLDNLQSLGYEQMTQIQALALPHILANKDIIAQAKTGSGKTATFGIGMILKIKPKFLAPQALVICPTRELATQVANSLRKLARHIPNIKIVELCGGMPMRPQIASLAAGAHILVGTPGRIDDHKSKNTIDFKHIQTFVLDEADKMLDMGFLENIKKIASNLSKNRQTLLFSATFPTKIKSLAQDILNNPLFVQAEVVHETTKIEHFFYTNEKLEIGDAVNRILSYFRPKSTIIFCGTKVFAKELDEKLYRFGHSVECLNGDLEQMARNEVLIRFANKSTAILVATDIASRGLDIAGVDMVLNIGLPHDNEVYIHRVGRTARGGETTGIAVSIVPIESYDKLDEIAHLAGIPQTSLADVTTLEVEKNICIKSDYFTLIFNDGKKNKLRAGDILGALSKDIGIDGKCIGKIDILENHSFVALHKSELKKIKSLGTELKVKGRKIRVFYDTQVLGKIH